MARLLVNGISRPRDRASKREQDVEFDQDYAPVVSMSHELRPQCSQKTNSCIGCDLGNADDGQSPAANRVLPTKPPTDGPKQEPTHVKQRTERDEDNGNGDLTHKRSNNWHRHFVRMLRVAALAFMIEVPAAEVNRVLPRYNPIWSFQNIALHPKILLSLVHFKGKALATILRDKNRFKNHYGGIEEHYHRRWCFGRAQGKSSPCSPTAGEDHFEPEKEPSVRFCAITPFSMKHLGGCCRSATSHPVADEGRFCLPTLVLNTLDVPGPAKRAISMCGKSGRGLPHSITLRVGPNPPGFRPSPRAAPRYSRQRVRR
jgi:hypothetical protein